MARFRGEFLRRGPCLLPCTHETLAAFVPFPRLRLRHADTRPRRAGAGGPGRGDRLREAEPERLQGGRGGDRDRRRDRR